MKRSNTFRSPVDRKLIEFRNTFNAENQFNQAFNILTVIINKHKLRTADLMRVGNPYKRGRAENKIINP